MIAWGASRAHPFDRVGPASTRYETTRDDQPTTPAHIVLHDPGQLGSVEEPTSQFQFDDALVNAERRAAVATAVQAVEPSQREVLVLREIEGLPYEVIAARTGSSLDSLRSKMTRGRQTFREVYASIADAADLWGGAVVASMRAVRTRTKQWLLRHPPTGIRQAATFLEARLEAVSVVAVVTVLAASFGSSTHTRLQSQVGPTNAADSTSNVRSGSTAHTFAVADSPPGSPARFASTSGVSLVAPSPAPAVVGAAASTKRESGTQRTNLQPH